MTDVYQPPSTFATHVTTEVVSAAAQTQIVDGIQSICALLGVTLSDAGAVTNWNAYQSTGANMAPPNFNRIPEATRRLIVNELAALAVAVEAHPTA